VDTVVGQHIDRDLTLFSYFLMVLMSDMYVLEPSHLSQRELSSGTLFQSVEFTSC
jgi:hypothetical protein